MEQIDFWVKKGLSINNSYVIVSKSCGVVAPWNLWSNHMEELPRLLWVLNWNYPVCLCVHSLIKLSLFCPWAIFFPISRYKYVGCPGAPQPLGQRKPAVEIKINDRPLKTSCGQENTFIELIIIDVNIKAEVSILPYWLGQVNITIITVFENVFWKW